MEFSGRATTRRRYRFPALAQARAHLREAGSRWLFFYRDEKLCLLPGAPVCLELGFEDGSPARLLRGQVQASLEGSGTWLEIIDPRPVHSTAEFSRATRRVGCELRVEVRGGGHIVGGALLDLSIGGARIACGAPLEPGEALELRVLSPDGLTFRDLALGQVAWTSRGEAGVRFDPADAIGRSAVTRLLREISAHWRRAWEARHPASCCKAAGLIEPEPPRLARPAAAAAHFAHASP